MWNFPALFQDSAFGYDNDEVPVELGDEPKEDYIDQENIITEKY